MGYEKYNGRTVIAAEGDAIFEYDTKKFRGKPRGNPGVGEYMGFLGPRPDGKDVPVFFLDIPNGESELIDRKFIRKAKSFEDGFVNFQKEADGTEKLCRVRFRSYTKNGVHVWVSEHDGPPLDPSVHVTNFKIYGKKKGNGKKKTPVAAAEGNGNKKTQVAAAEPPAPAPEGAEPPAPAPEAAEAPAPAPAAAEAPAPAPETADSPASAPTDTPRDQDSNAPTSVENSGFVRGAILPSNHPRFVPGPRGLTDRRAYIQKSPKKKVTTTREF